MTKGLHRLIEARIQDAQRRGEFDALPGKGQPLADDGLGSLPEEQRAEALLMRISGLPEEVALLREVAELREKFDSARDAEERQQIREVLYAKAVRLGILFEQSGKYLSARRIQDLVP
ncbi:protein of unknown function [Stigmatella aurantiaca]|jgi:hypothetical protein|uniref:DnaJ homologue subfamily C member 28 conserved domain-containing protein n=1 Tax=Stigmatella aurantiaca TaxID=41 RepID=A0A1H7MJC1_STIAU|nr:DUF1992 domain-containing protein [Stigmatella aurantiaca]SEL11353.1 protein of unknown function [Stigmatella aurantiaca]